MEVRKRRIFREDSGEKKKKTTDRKQKKGRRRRLKRQEIKVLEVKERERSVFFCANTDNLKLASC